MTLQPDNRVRLAAGTCVWLPISGHVDPLRKILARCHEVRKIQRNSTAYGERPDSNASVVGMGSEQVRQLIDQRALGKMFTNCHAVLLHG